MWWVVAAVVGGVCVGVVQGAVGVEGLARLHILDGVITNLLRAHLHHHLPEIHLPAHFNPRLASHLATVER